MHAPKQNMSFSNAVKAREKTWGQIYCQGYTCQFLFYLIEKVRILNICKVLYGQISLQFHALPVSIIMPDIKG